MTLSVIVSRAFALLLLLSLTSPRYTFASAVSCFDNITVDTTLDADLSCSCNFTSALLVEGPVKLDLGGHTIRCTDTDVNVAFCVELVGDGAKVQNGALSGCYYGAGGFPGFGNAVIRDITVDNTLFGIFALFSDYNKIINVEITNSIVVGIFALGGNNNVIKESYVSDTFSFEGIFFSGNSNKIIGNEVRNSFGWDCIGVAPVDGQFEDFSFDNVIKNNIIDGCGDAGLSIFANETAVNGNHINGTNGTSILISYTGNKVNNNYITNAGRDGIGVIEGDAIVVRNTIENSVLDGIDFQPFAGNGLAKDNTIMNCGNEGIQVRSDGHKIRNNIIVGCRVGIEILDMAGGNKLRGNEASGSILDDFIDVNAGCGTNSWRFNHGVGNQACVD